MAEVPPIKGTVDYKGNIDNQRAADNVLGDGKKTKDVTDAPVKDVVVQGTQNTAMVAQVNAQQEQIDALGRSLETLKTQQAERAEKEKDKGWLGKVLKEIFEIAIRIFFPVVNWISFALRFGRFLRKLVQEKKTDWRLLGGALADLCGATSIISGSIGKIGGVLEIPTGAAIAAGTNLYLNATRDDDKHEVYGWELEGRAGSRTALTKGKALIKGAWDKGSKLLGGKDTAATDRASLTGVETRFVQPATNRVS